MKRTAQTLVNLRRQEKQKNAGFTLVELLVVIAIIAILAAVVLLIINPLELTRRTRDAARLTDLANLQQAINVAVQDATSSGAAILCEGTTAPCVGNSVTGTRLANGTGWVKVNLSSQKSVSVPTLPIDPIGNPNTAANHYLYCSDGNAWVIVTDLESQAYQDKTNNDGGQDNGLYEVGSNLGLLGTGSCTY